MAKPKTFISIGHYPKRSGAVNTIYGLTEHHEAKKIVNVFFTHIITPQSLYSYIPVKSGPLKEKVAFINKEANEGSIAVEIHFNASDSRKAQGIETLFFPGSTQGKRLAGSIQQALLDLLPFKDRGIKERNNLYFLKATVIPAIIAEVLFIDNDQEASYLFYPRSHLLIANALFRGIEKHITEYLSLEREEKQ
ncbi:MAG: N-acetylmuramoyl-L-alanine amidase [bacterium]